jgi:hypothetical protein
MIRIGTPAATIETPLEQPPAEFRALPAMSFDQLGTVRVPPFTSRNSRGCLQFVPRHASGERDPSACRHINRCGIFLLVAQIAGGETMAKQ